MRPNFRWLNRAGNWIYYCLSNPFFRIQAPEGQTSGLEVGYRIQKGVISRFIQVDFIALQRLRAIMLGLIIGLEGFGLKRDYILIDTPNLVHLTNLDK